MNIRRILPLVPVLCLAGAAVGRAQSFTDVPDRFRLEIGGFRVEADSKLTLNRSGVSDTVDFEDDLGLDDSSNRAYVEGYWRLGRKHLLSLSWVSVNRDSAAKTLERTINWGGQVFPVGATASASLHSDYLSGAYRFAVYRNDRFEIGPALGFGYLNLTAGIDATGTGEAARNLSAEGTTDSPTGDVGAYFHWWPARRVLVRGDGRYIFLSPGNSEASVTDAKGTVLWHPTRRFAIGLQYTYSKFRYDRDILSTSLGGEMRLRGGQIILGYVF
jgi:hypothetical protein